MVSDMPVLCSRIDGVVTVVKAERPIYTCHELYWGKSFSAHNSLHYSSSQQHWADSSFIVTLHVKRGVLWDKIKNSAFCKCVKLAIWLSIRGNVVVEDRSVVSVCKRTNASIFRRRGCAILQTQVTVTENTHISLGERIWLLSNIDFTIKNLSEGFSIICRLSPSFPSSSSSCYKCKAVLFHIWTFICL